MLPTRINKEEVKTIKPKYRIIDEVTSNYNPLLVFGFCLIISSLFLLIGTKSSPLYPLNDWVDTNSSFTMGKAMLNGKVLYRDIFDHRGPLLYFVFGLAYLIANTSFLGVYILEVISSSIFLYFCFKIFSLFLDWNISLIILPLISTLIINSKNFTHGGSPEEFCLPLVAISLFVLLNYFKVIYPKPFFNRQVFINGVIAGCILWIKFSLLGFWFGWILSIFILKLKTEGFLQGLKSSLIFVLGMLTATLPWIVYFGINNSIIEWINSYIIINITAYPRTTSLFPSYSRTIPLYYRVYSLLLTKFQSLQSPNLVVFLGLGLVLFLLNKNYLKNSLSKLSLLFCFSFLFLGVYGGGRNYIYYFIIFFPFLVFGFIVLFDFVNERFGTLKSGEIPYIIFLISFVVSFSYIFGFNQNTYMLALDKEDLVQYKFAEIIHQTKDPTLLNYGDLDGGFYTTTGIIPNVRFFMKANFAHSRLPIIKDEQNRYVHEQVVDYIDMVVEASNYEDNIKYKFLDEK